MTPLELARPPLGPADVEIRVECVGLCHSDLNLIDGDWGDESVYPQVCGHEIVGTIVAKGQSVEHVEIGQRVGVGWQAASCLHCQWCLAGDEPLCGAMKTACSNGEIGGFADYFSCDGNFVFAIPDEISSAEAAPLLCAGITVFSALEPKVRPGQRVAILGVGGLGHLAIQFAAKMGGEVTAVSTSQRKRAQAQDLGASTFLSLNDEASLIYAAGRFDFILVTSGAAYDWPLILECLKPRGEICFAGIPHPVTLDLARLIYKVNTLSTVNIGGRAMMLRMLDFARRFDVRPMVETMPMFRINDAVERLRRNEATYRLVLTDPARRDAASDARQ